MSKEGLTMIETPTRNSAAREADSARIRHLLSKLGPQELFAFVAKLDQLGAGDRAALRGRSSASVTKGC